MDCLKIPSYTLTAQTLKNFKTQIIGCSQLSLKIPSQRIDCCQLSLKIPSYTCRAQTPKNSETQRMDFCSQLSLNPKAQRMDFCSELSLNLLIDGLKRNETLNLVVSPLSYNVILNLIAGGASGDTLKEMLRFLQCRDITEVNSNSMKMMGFTSEGGGDDNNGSGPVIECLNGIWIEHQYGLKSSYQDLAHKIYKAQIKSADFENKADEVVDEANAWAKASTKGLITEVLKHGDLDDAIIVLGNALYFKGLWEDGFKPRLTMDRPFYLMKGTQRTVPFMTGCDKYSSRSFDGFKVVSIPYQIGNNGNMFSMYIFLPDDRLGLQNLLLDFASDSGFLRQDFKLYNWGHYDIFWIPKFKFSYNTSEGKETMQKMGLVSPFSDGLQEMVNGQQIQISKIVQKSFIEVDEKGTKAAAVTSTFGIMGCGEPSRKTEFVADHPFMFMIREEKTKFILFTGVVLDPTLE